MRRFALAAALSFVGATVFAQDVKTDFDRSADFGKYKTFAVKIGTSWNNQISEKRITEEIAQTLTEKGWTRVDANPDALVLLHGATEKQQSLNTFYSGGYGGYGYRGWGGMGGMGTATTTTSEYMVGTLVVDIFDAKSKACSSGDGLGRDLGQAGEEHQEGRQGREQDVQGLPAGIEGEEVGPWGNGRQTERTLRGWPACGPAPGGALPPRPGPPGRGMLAAVLLVALPGGLAAQTTIVTCTSKPGERQECPADTSKGVALARSQGEAACLLGKTWGYDDKGVWVSDGCSAEFVVGQGLSEAMEKVEEAKEKAEAAAVRPQRRLPDHLRGEGRDLRPALRATRAT